jgi:hypothetical protein
VSSRHGAPDAPLDQADAVGLIEGVTRFNAEGVPGLRDRSKSGPPEWLDEGQLAAFKAVVLRGPAAGCQGRRARVLSGEASMFAQRGTVMDARRRTWLIWLASGWFMPAALIRAAVAQEGRRRVVEARIENRKVVAPSEAIQITEGDVIELRWTSDEAVDLHLHGYDLELHVRPDEPAAMVIEAYATGRFPITSHGWGKGGHGHDELTYLEVYPR